MHPAQPFTRKPFCRFQFTAHQHPPRRADERAGHVCLLMGGCAIRGVRHNASVHELGIAVSIVEGACEELSKLGPMRVQAVRLRLGALSGVAKDALLFSFEAAAAGTPIEGARLDIEDVPAAVWCGRCRAERTLARISHRRCPSCDAVTPEILRGEDLEIVGLEVADA